MLAIVRGWTLLIFEVKSQGHNGHVRGLSGKIADTANKTRTVYHRLLKLCINKYVIRYCAYPI